MNILVTGGTGYIGSHTVVKLIEAKHTVTIIDNLINSSEEVIARIEKITGTRPAFYSVDLLDKEKLQSVFSENSFDSVIHFAALKAVGESVQKPLAYYRNNIDSTLSLLEVMDESNVRKLVFSSSATVYGTADVPYAETATIGIGVTNPYGQTKFFIEQILKDTSTANPANEFVSLRYFNPVGAHQSGLIGEDPSGIPNNLMPFIAQVASGKRSELAIFGNDYETSDGTCERDFIHVEDLAKGHLAALENTTPGYDAINLGSGTGTSVLQLVNAFQSATGKTIPYTIAPRRAGDLPAFWADVQKAAEKLNWKTEKTIEEMCADTWNWQSQNPNGFAK